ncbi:ABC transporter transmembrane domain-containing protein [uncultured Tateyamaria sp.]|uniref:ABC transporter transmembrane domain-containing protein n=1 Tax=Tateyamaria sp. 1078 TaxID=3417464 RepID=UPI002637E6DC|nr:ABC transporter transmembrane domain-containing protein [uncultured Tateyamaria sp.]
MTTLPHVATQDRVIDAVLIISLGILQATALAVAAFATRDAFAALHNGAALTLRTVCALAGAGVIVALCLFLARRRAEALGQSYAITLRRALYGHIARLPTGRHAQRRLGALSLRFVGDLSAARLWFGRGLPDVLTALVILPAAVAILVALDTRLATAALIPLGLTIIAMTGMAWHLEQRHRRLRARRASIAIGMIERIAIAPDLDLMGRTSKELRALDTHGASLRRAAVARRGRTAGLQAILQVGMALSGLTVLWQASLGGGAAPATVAACLSVLALVALPLQDLGASWDSFCAWRIARVKLLRLFGEPTVKRRARRAGRAPTVTLRGTCGGASAHFTASGGTIATLRHPRAAHVARCISGLDPEHGLEVQFDTRTSRPKVAHIGDAHVALQGSLRRSATLTCAKRPSDDAIIATLTAFGLHDLLCAPRGLDQRIAENGRGLSHAQTLRLDLARAVLGQANVIVIASLRWAVEPDQDLLMQTLMSQAAATVIIAETGTAPTPPDKHRVD